MTAATTTAEATMLVIIRPVMVLILFSVDHSLAVSLLSRLAHRAGLVTVRQTFVRRSHGGNRPCPGGSMMRNGTSSALKSEQDLASILMAGGGLSRLAIARLKSAGVPVAP